MKLSMKPISRAIVVSASLGLGACTFLVDRDNAQCSTNDDCLGFSATAVCQDSICVAPTGVGQPGCFPGTPETPEQLLNACTNAEWLPFDNCEKLGLCTGELPETVAPGAPPAPGATNPPTPPTALCKDIAAQLGTKTVYVTGSSNFPPFLKAFAPILATKRDDQERYSVVWQTSSSCAGVDAIYNEFASPAPDPTKKVMKERAGRVTELYDPSGNAIPCLIDGEVVADVGESDIYAQTCADNIGYDPTPNRAPNPSVAEYFGPVMGMAFIVPARSTQRVISAEAARVVFGRGQVPDPRKLPWNDARQIWNRAPSTATNQIMSRAIFVDPTKWWGVDKRTASDMVGAMEAVEPALAEQTIGIISADFASSERARGVVRTLAFQARGQSVGFFPDSRLGLGDRRNVRDGHYPLWGPIHFFVRRAGGELSPAASAFAIRFSGTRLDKDLVEGIIRAGNVPACAMNVARTEEMGPIQKSKPAYACGCFFDSLTTSTSCQRCEVSQNCPPDKNQCNYGFCEAP